MLTCSAFQPCTSVIGASSSHAAALQSSAAGLQSSAAGLQSSQVQLDCSQVKCSWIAVKSSAAGLQSSQVQLDCSQVKCSWIASHVILQLDLFNLAMKEATKEYTVVSWGDEENTLSIICIDAILSGDRLAKQ